MQRIPHFPAQHWFTDHFLYDIVTTTMTGSLQVHGLLTPPPTPLAAAPAAVSPTPPLTPPATPLDTPEIWLQTPTPPHTPFTSAAILEAMQFLRPSASPMTISATDVPFSPARARVYFPPPSPPPPPMSSTRPPPAPKYGPDVLLKPVPYRSSRSPPPSTRVDVQASDCPLSHAEDDVSESILSILQSPSHVASPSADSPESPLEYSIFAVTVHIIPHSYLSSLHPTDPLTPLSHDHLTLPILQFPIHTASTLRSFQDQLEPHLVWDDALAAVPHAGLDTGTGRPVLLVRAIFLPKPMEGRTENLLLTADKPWEANEVMFPQWYERDVIAYLWRSEKRMEEVKRLGFDGVWGVEIWCVLGEGWKVSEKESVGRGIFDGHEDDGYDEFDNGFADGLGSKGTRVRRNSM